jgi:hypothetical protein
LARSGDGPQSHRADTRPHRQARSDGC